MSTQDISTVDDSYASRWRRLLAALALLACLPLSSWCFEHWFSDRHTSQMHVAEAVTALRRGGLDQRERELALRIVKNEAIGLVELIKADDSQFAGLALQHISNATER